MTFPMQYQNLRILCICKIF